ncbi:MAG: hypothetical protein U0V75_12415 [Ferruginibacter sp.]
MEFTQQQDNTIFDEFTINEEAKAHITDIARWANLNAILGLFSLVMSVFSSVMAIIKMLQLNGSSNAAIMAGTLISLLVTIGITLLMNIVLLQAAANMKKGVQRNDQGLFSAGTGKLATYFRVFAIVLIIAMVIIVLVLLFTLVMIGGRSF